MKILEGKPIKQHVLDEIQEYIQKGVKIKPFLLYNSHYQSAVKYKKLISKELKKLNIASIELNIISEEQLKATILKINAVKDACIFICRPLGIPKEIELYNLIDSDKDVDMITARNLGYLLQGDLNYLSGTAQSVKEIIDYYNIDVVDKKVLVIGRSVSVGKPIAQLMAAKNGLATLAHSKVCLEHIRDGAKRSDIIILASGKRGIITEKEISDKQVIIDCGYGKDGKGDLGFVPCCKAYTPVPGGVGPITIVSVIKNAFKLKIVNEQKL